MCLVSQEDPVGETSLFCLLCLCISQMDGTLMTCSSITRRSTASYQLMTAACPRIRKLIISLRSTFLCISKGVYLKQIKVEPELCIFSRVPLERDNSEEFLKREARAAQLAEEIEASASYKARVALENDERSEEEKYTAVMRGERDPHTLSRCQ